jgi:uncharacterized protein YjiK
LKRTINYIAFLLSGGLILLSGTLPGCKEKDKTDPEINLSLISEFELSVSEASGLCLFRNPNEFLTVSDKTNEIYVVSNKGQLLRNFNFTGQDLEGVAYDPALNNIFIVEETSRQIFRLDTNGVEQSRFPIDIYFEDDKHGPEGISFNAETNHLFIVIEKKPGKLLELDLNGEIINDYHLSFADDYSAIFFDPVENQLWILSDESKTLTHCDITGKALNKYNTGITKGEGLVVDTQNKLAYIVSDQENKMYVLSIP